MLTANAKSIVTTFNTTQHFAQEIEELKNAFQLHGTPADLYNHWWSIVHDLQTTQDAATTLPQPVTL